jgi:hypothetical protein
MLQAAAPITAKIAFQKKMHDVSDTPNRKKRKELKKKIKNEGRKKEGF